VPAAPGSIRRTARFNAAEQVGLKLGTLRRDGMTHLAMPPLEFTRRHIEWRHCRSQIDVRYVSSGSASAGRARDLTAGKLPPSHSAHVATQ
jgi:hypothetical protein